MQININKKEFNILHEFFKNNPDADNVNLFQLLTNDFLVEPSIKTKENVMFFMVRYDVGDVNDDCFGEWLIYRDLNKAYQTVRNIDSADVVILSHSHDNTYREIPYNEYRDNHRIESDEDFREFKFDYGKSDSDIIMTISNNIDGYATIDVKVYTNEVDYANDISEYLSIYEGQVNIVVDILSYSNNLDHYESIEQFNISRITPDIEKDIIYVNEYPSHVKSCKRLKKIFDEISDYKVEYKQ